MAAAGKIETQMKKTLLPIALLTVSLAFVGCQLFEKTPSSPPVSEGGASAMQTTETTQAAVQTQGSGLACSLCVCSKFEPQSDAPSVCRMCGHNASDHNRR